MHWRTKAAALISVAGLWAATSQTSLFADIGTKAGPTNIFHCGVDTTKKYINNGDGTFEDLVHPSGMDRNTKSMGWG